MRRRCRTPRFHAQIHGPAIKRPAWWAPGGVAAIPTTAIDPPHSAASPAVPALSRSGLQVPLDQESSIAESWRLRRGVISRIRRTADCTRGRCDPMSRPWQSAPSTLHERARPQSFEHRRLREALELARQECHIRSSRRTHRAGSNTLLLPSRYAIQRRSWPRRSGPEAPARATQAVTENVPVSHRIAAAPSLSLLRRLSRRGGRLRHLPRESRDRAAGLRGC